MLIRQHPWNIDPLPPPKYRLVVELRSQQTVATARNRDALMDLAAQFEGLGYDFLRLERIPT